MVQCSLASRTNICCSCVSWRTSLHVSHATRTANMQGKETGEQSSRAASRILRLLPDLDLIADNITINSSGTHAAISGIHRDVSAALSANPICF